MMKKYLLFCILLMLSSQIKAQKVPVSAEYIYSCDSLKIIRENTILYFDTISIFRSLDKIELAKKVNDAMKINDVKTIYDLSKQPITKYDVYKDLKNKTCYIKRNIRSNQYLIPFKNQKINWEILDSVKQIGPYASKAASCVYEGKKYFAWFSLEIKISDGPGEFYGLPGLILKLYDSKNTISYNLKQINFSQEKSELSTITNYQIISAENFNILYKVFLRESVTVKQQEND